MSPAGLTSVLCRIVLSKAATPAVRALLPLTPVGKDGPKVGNAIEVNPLSLAIAEDLAIRLKRHGYVLTTTRRACSCLFHIHRLRVFALQGRGTVR